MKARAKLFQNGGSQAVRLPKDCRFPVGQTEVIVRRQGQCIVLEPVDAWPTAFLETLGAWPSAIPRPRRDKLTKLGDPFE